MPSRKGDLAESESSHIRLSSWFRPFNNADSDVWIQHADQHHARIVRVAGQVLNSLSQYFLENLTTRSNVTINLRPILRCVMEKGCAVGIAGVYFRFDLEAETRCECPSCLGIYEAPGELSATELALAQCVVRLGDAVRSASEAEVKHIADVTQLICSKYRDILPGWNL